MLAGQALIRATGGAISRIDTYRAGSQTVSFDAATASFTGTATASVSYEYDANARLTRETQTSAGSGDKDTRYSSDTVGSRLQKLQTTAAGAEVTSYSYNPADRITSETTSLAAGGSRATSYGWDQNDNLASRTETGKTTLYRFDPQNRLIDIRTGATQAEASAAAPGVSYAYDAAGSRVKKTTRSAQGSESTGITSYLIDRNQSYAQVVLETRTITGTGTSTESIAYVWGNQLIRQTRGGAGTLFANPEAANDLFPLQGHLNTSLGAVDANGDLVEQTQGDAFGLLDQATGLKQKHLYTGEYWDQDSELLYLRARWYDPKIGRFVSADPFEGRQTDPRSLNRYSYVQSDPLSNIDPSGLFAVNDPAISSGMSLTISSANTTAGSALATTVLRKVVIRLLVAGVALAPAQLNVLEQSCAKTPQDPSCATDVPAIFFGANHAGHAALIQRAYNGTRSFGPLTYSFKNEANGMNRDWYKNRPECKGLTGRSPGLDCDEFPYFKQEEGGLDNYMKGSVLLEPMNFSVNRSAGSTWGVFLSKCQVLPDAGSRSKHMVIPLPQGTSAQTFWTGKSCR